MSSSNKKKLKKNDGKKQTTLNRFLECTFSTAPQFRRPLPNTLASLSRTPINFPPQSPYHHHYNDRSFSIFKGCAVRHGQPPLTCQLTFTQRLNGKALPSHTKQVMARKYYSQLEPFVTFSNVNSTTTCMDYISSFGRCITGNDSGIVRCFDTKSWYMNQQTASNSIFTLSCDKAISNVKSYSEKLLLSCQNYVMLYDLSSLTLSQKYSFDSQVLDFQIWNHGIVCALNNGHVKYLDMRQNNNIQQIKVVDDKMTQNKQTLSLLLSNPSSGFGVIGGNRQHSKLASKRRMVIPHRSKMNNNLTREQTKYLSINTLQVSSCSTLLFVGTATGHCNVLDMRYINALICDPVKSIYMPDMIRHFENTSSVNRCKQNLFDQQSDPLANHQRTRSSHHDDNELMVIENEDELFDSHRTLEKRFNDYSRLESKYHPITSLVMDPNDGNKFAFTTGNGYVGYIVGLQREQPVIQKLYKYSNIIPSIYLNNVNSNIKLPRPCFLTDFGASRNCFFCMPNQNKFSKNNTNNYVTIFDWSLHDSQEIFKEEIDIGTMTRTIETNSGSLRDTMLIEPIHQNKTNQGHAMNETVCVVQDPNNAMIVCAGTDDTIVTLIDRE